MLSTVRVHRATSEFRMVKMASQQGRRRSKNGGVAFLTRPTPRCHDSLFSKWGTLKIFAS